MSDLPPEERGLKYIPPKSVLDLFYQERILRRRQLFFYILFFHASSNFKLGENRRHLPLNLLLELQETVQQRLRPGRPPGHIDIHRPNEVRTLHHTIGIERP